MKKRVVWAFWGLLFAPSLMAQDVPNVLIKDPLTLSRLGLMVQAGYQATRMAAEPAHIFNFKTGVVFDDKITIGGFYGQMVNRISPLSLAGSLPASAHLDAYQVGGFVEYTVKATKLLHLAFPISIGFTEMEIDEEGPGKMYEESKTFFVEPGANLELNLHRYARLQAGLGYRIMGGMIEKGVGVPEVGVV